MNIDKFLHFQSAFICVYLWPNIFSRLLTGCPLGPALNAQSRSRHGRSAVGFKIGFVSSSRLLKKARGITNDGPGGLSHNITSTVCRRSGIGFPACQGLFQQPAREVSRRCRNAGVGYSPEIGFVSPADVTAKAGQEACPTPEIGFVSSILNFRRRHLRFLRYLFVLNLGVVIGSVYA
jgi:hypothetical protein